MDQNRGTTMKYLIAGSFNFIITLVCLYWSLVAMSNHHIIVFCYGVLMSILNFVAAAYNLNQFIVNRKIKVME